MKAVLALLLGVAFGYDQNPYSKLEMNEGWKQEFGKEYKDMEAEGEAFVVFMENWKMINDFNIAGEETFTMRMNQFSDMTGDQFKLYIHGHDGSCMRKRTVQERVAMEEVTPEVDAPASIDWTNNGGNYVTPVKNQGQCGSCWAYSTTGAIESRTAIANQKTGNDIVTLSEQELVDCSGSYGNMGCNGGLMDDAFKYVEANGGLCSEEEYPYTAKDGTCQKLKCTTKYDPISSYSDVKADNVADLEAAVAEGPVSIAIEADQSAFQFYSGGVLTGTCGTRLDHGVLVIGYGETGGDKFESEEFVGRIMGNGWLYLDLQRV